MHRENSVLSARENQMVNQVKYSPWSDPARLFSRPFAIGQFDVVLATFLLKLRLLFRSELIAWNSEM